MTCWALAHPISVSTTMESIFRPDLFILTVPFPGPQGLKALRSWPANAALKGRSSTKTSLQRGSKSVRENACRPTRAFGLLHPALPCRAFTSRRYAAGVLVVLAPPLAFNGSSHAVSRSYALSKPMKGASNRLWGTLVFPVARSKCFLCGRRGK